MKKIKVKTHKPRVHGSKQNRNVQINEKAQVQRFLQEQARRRRMTRRDVETGEEYILQRLVLVNKNEVDDYRDGLTGAIQIAEEDAAAQAEAIRAYLQIWIDAEKLRAIPCGSKDKPSCRYYTTTKRVVAIRQDDPELGGRR